MIPDPELERLREEVAALRKEVAALSRHALELRRELGRETDALGGQVTDLTGRVSGLDRRVTKHDAGAQALDQKIRGILESRIWRTLTKLGGAALRLRGELSPAEAELAVPSASLLLGTPASAAAPSYELWQADHEGQSELEHELRLASLEARPRFAVITAEQIAPQIYENFEVRTSEAELSGSTAEWVILLEPGDRLAATALLAIAEAVDRNPGATVVYSDHDCLDPAGRRADPVFKPDWSPERFLCEDYVCRAVAFRRDRELRVHADERAVCHVSEVLFHLRGGERAAEPRRVRHPLPASHRVSVIVLSGGRLEILRHCLDSILTRTGYDDFEIVVADNSRDSAVKEYLQDRPTVAVPIRRLDFCGRAFNFSAIANEAAAACSPEFVLFLNDDTTVETPDWIAAMVELAALPDAGAVGALLLFPDGRIQHAGVTLGIGGLCEHTLLRCALDHPSAHVAQVAHEVSAVTGACLMVPAARFREFGGFDAERFPVNFNDIDLCLRMRRAGLRVLYTPHARLVHHEAYTRMHTGQASPSLEELQALRTRWPREFETDPYYNPNLNHEQADYTLRRRSWQAYSRS